jgi:hypothetical protein
MKKSHNKILKAILGVSLAILVQLRNCRPIILYQQEKVSEHIYYSVIFVDFKAGKASNIYDPVVEVIELSRKTPLGQAGIAQK